MVESIDELKAWAKGLDNRIAPTVVQRIAARATHLVCAVVASEETVPSLYRARCIIATQRGLHTVTARLDAEQGWTVSVTSRRLSDIEMIDLEITEIDLALAAEHGVLLVHMRHSDPLRWEYERTPENPDDAAAILTFADALSSLCESL